MAGDLVVEAQELFADALGLGVEDGVADVVAQCAEVGGVVVEAFEFQEEGAGALGGLGDVGTGGFFDGEAVGEGVADGGVATDAFGKGEAVLDGAAFEEFLDAFVDEPEAGFEAEDGLADDGEAEVAGFDESGVDGADRDLVDAVALDL
ncbi:hypothetical protein [Streptomyces sp. A1-5]|uniref:hypothetical protein n=1 Tax=Streptomyces sp. A1-5 TaxID=2738410 RepID=UPI001F390FB5|nr:hypothetical protein [Streptomyces sp. A1-5]